MVKFKDLAIGDTFDFVNPERDFNSFYLRCRKVSARNYVAEDKQYSVGSVNVEVFNVVREEKE